jgi:hypothetical protein
MGSSANDPELWLGRWHDDYRIGIVPDSLLQFGSLTLPDQLRGLLFCANGHRCQWRRHKTIASREHSPRDSLDSGRASLLPDFDTVLEAVPWSILPTRRPSEVAAESHLRDHDHVDHRTVISCVSPRLLMR